MVNKKTMNPAVRTEERRKRDIPVIFDRRKDRAVGCEMTARRLEMLVSALGPDIMALLYDPGIIEVFVNPDGSLWLDRLGEGKRFTGKHINATSSESVIRLVAACVGRECNAESPILSAVLPNCGSRFQGLLPPLVKHPAFCIRKKPTRVFSLEDYVRDGIMSKRQREILSAAVSEKQNIVIAGGTGSGKTTLTNAIIDEIAKTEDRLVVLEDTRELNVRAKNRCCLLTSDAVSMRALVKATLRLTPDRIIVGEVRDGAALDLLKAWNTGHPGGVTTVHANSAEDALERLEQLTEEASVNIPYRLIGKAIDCVVFIEKAAGSRRVKEIIEVAGYTRDAYKTRLLS